MDKEQLIEQLNLIRDKKEKAVTAQSYEMASQLRDREKELMQQLDDIDNDGEKHSR
jgi:predicted transcriptional regulator